MSCRCHWAAPPPAFSRGRGYDLARMEQPMPPSQSEPSRPLPRGLLIVGTVVIAFHLGCLVLQALDVPSGPWTLGPGETSPAPEPQFVKSPFGFNRLDIVQTVRFRYLHLLHLDHNFNLAGNRAEDP